MSAVDRDIRCWRCRRVIAHQAARPWRIDCSRCHAKNASSPEPVVVPRPTLLTASRPAS